MPKEVEDMASGTPRIWTESTRREEVLPRLSCMQWEVGAGAPSALSETESQSLVDWIYDEVVRGVRLERSPVEVACFEEGTA